MNNQADVRTPGPVLGFAAGTPVHTREGLKPIEAVQVGDWVLSHPLDQPPPLRRRLPQEYTWRRVAATSTSDCPGLARIRYRNLADNIEDTLQSTPAQALWSKTDGWIAAASMRPGQAVVLSFNGNALVMDGSAQASAIRVHALRVEEFGSYFVGRLGVWVRSDVEGRALPPPPAREPVDFSKPQVLLNIKDYYNDTFLEARGPAKAPAAPAASSSHYVAPTEPLPAMQRAIDTLRSGFASVQKRLAGPRLTALCAAPPSWMKDSDGLMEVLRQQSLLLAQGEIVWGALIQANKLLFAPGRDDCPALLVYSADRYFDAHPDELRAVGRQMFSLKDTNPADPVLKAAALKVSDEAARDLGFRLPAVFSAREISAATFMVFRRHIPQGVLTAGLFPILTHPSTPAVMIVPSDFWPLDLSVMWSERRL